MTVLNVNIDHFLMQTSQWVFTIPAGAPNPEWETHRVIDFNYSKKEDESISKFILEYLEKDPRDLVIRIPGEAYLFHFLYYTMEALAYKLGATISLRPLDVDAGFFIGFHHDTKEYSLALPVAPGDGYELIIQAII